MYKGLKKAIVIAAISTAATLGVCKLYINAVSVRSDDSPMTQAMEEIISNPITKLTDTSFSDGKRVYGISDSRKIFLDEAIRLLPTKIKPELDGEYVTYDAKLVDKSPFGGRPSLEDNLYICKEWNVFKHGDLEGAGFMCYEYEVRQYSDSLSPEIKRLPSSVDGDVKLKTTRYGFPVFQREAEPATQEDVDRWNKEDGKKLTLDEWNEEFAKEDDDAVRGILGEIKKLNKYNTPDKEQVKEFLKRLENSKKDFVSPKEQSPHSSII